MSITLRNRNITVNSSTFQGKADDVDVLLVSLHKQPRIHKVQLSYSKQLKYNFLQDQEIRIVFLNMDMMNAVWVLCQVRCTLNKYDGILYAIATQAYQRRMVFPKYVWITYYVGDFNTSIDCPNGELHQYVHGVLAMDSMFITSTSSRNIKVNIQFSRIHQTTILCILHCNCRELIA